MLVHARALLCAKHLPQVSKTTKSLLKPPLLPTQPFLSPGDPHGWSPQTPLWLGPVGPPPRASPCSIALREGGSAGRLGVDQRLREGVSIATGTRKASDPGYSGQGFGAGAAVPRGYPGALRCSQFAAGVHPSPAGSGTPLSLGWLHSS